MSKVYGCNPAMVRIESRLAAIESTLSAISNKIHLIYSGSLLIGESGAKVPGINKYQFYFAKIKSSYGGGVAIGSLYGNSIRFFGKSDTAQTSLFFSSLNLEFSDDTVTNLKLTSDNSDNNSVQGIEWLCGISWGNVLLASASADEPAEGPEIIGGEDMRE